MYLLGKKGLSLRTLPSSAPASTVGGWLAQSGAGYGSYEYGWGYESIDMGLIIFYNGNIGLVENIADYGGLIIAYHAYKLSSKGEPEMIDGFTGGQRFFLSYAQSWRESDTNEFLRTLTLSNVHSPAKFRVNVLTLVFPLKRYVLVCI